MRVGIDGCGGTCFPTEVLGTGDCQDALRGLCGPPARDGAARQFEAELVFEDATPLDPMAVGVYIDKTSVGFLPIGHARQWRARHGAAGMVRCRAVVRDGSAAGREAPGELRVWLDLQW